METYDNNNMTLTWLLYLQIKVKWMVIYSPVKAFQADQICWTLNTVNYD